MTIIAIDPGKSGGIASIWLNPVHKKDEIAVGAMPETVKDIANKLDEHNGGGAVAYLEHIQGFAGEGRPGLHMFGLGENFGILQGILTAWKIRVVLVRPQKWQKFYSLGTRSACKSDNEWKNKLKAEAQRRFPNLNVTLATADALLLLDYAIRQERNQSAHSEKAGGG